MIDPQTLSGPERERVKGVLAFMVQRAKETPLSLSDPADSFKVSAEADAYAYRQIALNELEGELVTLLTPLED